jgi:hypothetical protein
VTNYLRQLQDLSPTPLEAATREAVQQWMDRTAGAEVAYWPSTTGPPATHSSSSELDHKMALLAKRQATLNIALRQS